jgi:uncharacterized protein DUF4440
MVRNDPEDIGRYMADDWLIVGPDGSTTDKAAFLAQVAGGDLVHEVMESHDIKVRLYGDAALLLARGISAGRFQGCAFREYERSSNVFVRQGATWHCVFTHLSRLAETDSA